MDNEPKGEPKWYTSPSTQYRKSILYRIDLPNGPRETACLELHKLVFIGQPIFSERTSNDNKARTQVYSLEEDRGTYIIVSIATTDNYSRRKTGDIVRRGYPRLGNSVWITTPRKSEYSTASTRSPPTSIWTDIIQILAQRRRSSTALALLKAIRQQRRGLTGAALLLCIQHLRVIGLVDAVTRVQDRKRRDQRIATILLQPGCIPLAAHPRYHATPAGHFVALLLHRVQIGRRIEPGISPPSEVELAAMSHRFRAARCKS